MPIAQLLFLLPLFIFIFLTDNSVEEIQRLSEASSRTLAALQNSVQPVRAVSSLCQSQSLR